MNYQTSSINILLIGSGGREHALAWKMKQSPLVKQLYCSPGNGGIEKVAELVPLAGDEQIIAFCKEKAIDLVVVGPEQPLVDGLSDALRLAGIKVFGCSKAAAQLEGSKGFTKDICAKYDIPTAAYGRFADRESAKAYVLAQGAPIVVKADGLAAGKGVIMAETNEQALTAIDEIFGGKFGDAGAEVVIEEWLQGEEASFFALCDGENVRMLGSAQDHKRVGEGDTGPNTGGMGTYTPAPVMTPAVEQQVMEEIIKPTVEAMKAEGMPFQGIFFAGLMITAKGPQLIEYNVRFGDPETQSLMLRLESDIVPLFLACAEGEGLEACEITLSEEAAICVVMAAKGYPGAYEKGSEIKGLTQSNATIFHAGTRNEAGKTIAIGGRVLGVCAKAPNFEAARSEAYAAIKAIDWPEGFYRNDIGWRAVERKAS
jgi:phosphoribosylamine--glycine ligase